MTRSTTSEPAVGEVRRKQSPDGTLTYSVKMWVHVDEDLSNQQIMDFRAIKSPGEPLGISLGGTAGAHSISAEVQELVSAQVKAAIRSQYPEDFPEGGDEKESKPRITKPVDRRKGRENMPSPYGGAV